MPSQARSSILALVCGLAAVSFCAVQAFAGEPPVGERIEVPTSRGKEPLTLLSPDAFESAVQPDNPQASPIRVRGRVIIHSPDRAPIDGVLANLRLQGALRPADPTGEKLRGFWLLDGASVRQAALIAEALRADPRITEAHLDIGRFQPRSPPTDPGFTSQWFLNNAPNPAASINVLSAWMSGVTGTGVIVGLIDQGFNTTHPDLAANFNSGASQPTSIYTNYGQPIYSGHGTATAGLVGAAANNGIGGVGVAYGSQIARLYFYFESDNAAAFAFHNTGFPANQMCAIKSNSWGPFSPGNIYPMSAIELAALEGAVTSGRGGKGEVFFWAAAEGGASNSDRTDYDGYGSNRFSINVSSIDNIDRAASYAEPGSSLMLATTSSYDFSGALPSGIYTTSGTNTYTGAFGGTSAACPIAAGVAALMLQARPDLTWRDVQHVLIRSARRVNSSDVFVNPTNPLGWQPNGAGRFVHYKYGFGAIDATAAVTLAQTFSLRTAERTYASPLTNVATPIPDNPTPPNPGVSSTINVPANLTVERVQVVINAPHASIGDLRVVLTSPTGSSSLFADLRNDSTPGYTNHTYTSVRHWDERSHGPWTLTITDLRTGTTGTFTSWQIKVYGATPDCPANWNGGALNVADIFAFLADWFAGYADFNGDGVTNVADIFAFLSSWFAGCP